MILVLGSGNFATSLAQHLAQKSKVVIYSRRQEVVHSINTWNKNPTAFPDFVLHHNISAIGQFSQQLLDSAAYIVYSIPTQAQRSVLLQIAPFLTTQLLIFVNKGIEISTGKLPSEICADILGPLAQTCAYLSGPSFAAEIMLGQPTACSISSPSPESARRCHALFQSENFLIYDSLDVIGLQIAGALKNVIALASGACMGVGFMQNSRAALITRGLAEITRFGIALGADPITFSGLSGVGDLFLTCSSEKSRNFRLGLLIGQGVPCDEALVQIGSVAEGVTTTKAAYELAQKLNVRAPITEVVYRALYEKLPVKDAARMLYTEKYEHQYEFEQIKEA